MNCCRFALLFGIGATSCLWADVDLVTVPGREGTQLTIYNSEDITLVREHRLLTVKKGINRIQFSWENTLIDPTSIDFRILSRLDQVDLTDTSFPSGRADALQWNIKSRIAGKVLVEIRYFTSGITWKAGYVGVANEDESELRLTGYVRIFNNSGELYDNAQVRLVVGTINLVEKIADLAQRPAPGKDRGDRPSSDRFELGWRFQKALSKADSNFSGYGGGAGFKDAMPAKPKQVVKEGLSEYFLFTIEGREDIQVEQPVRLVAMTVANVPLESVYKLSDREDGDHFAKYYRFKNQKLRDDRGDEKELPDMENLGVSPLPDGSVRLYSEYSNNDLAYVGGTTTKYVPIRDRVEVNVGRETDITIARRLIDQKITKVVSRQYKRRIDDEFVMLYDLVDYDEAFYYEEEIVSGKPVDVKIELERRFDANVILWAEDAPPDAWQSGNPGAYVDLHDIDGRKERVDANHVKYFLDLTPGEKRLVKYCVTYKRRRVMPELNQVKKREPL